MRPKESSSSNNIRSKPKPFRVNPEKKSGKNKSRQLVKTKQSTSTRKNKSKFLNKKNFRGNDFYKNIQVSLGILITTYIIIILLLVLGLNKDVVAIFVLFVGIVSIITLIKAPEKAKIIVYSSLITMVIVTVFVKSLRFSEKTIIELNRNPLTEWIENLFETR